jgi:hypothetical protein
MYVAARSVSGVVDVRAHHPISAEEAAALTGRSMYAVARSASGVIGIPAVVFVGCAHATGVLGVAFPLALMARDTCFPRALAHASCCRHDC